MVDLTHGGYKNRQLGKKHYKENPFYKKNKKILDYAFTAGGKSSRAPGMSLSEVLDDAKYKIGGGVTFSGKHNSICWIKKIHI